MNDSPYAPLPLAVQTLGRGPALMLFHGGMGSRNHWCRNLEPLSRHFTVHAVDLPGYGDSPGVPTRATLDEYVGYIVDGIRPVVGAAPFLLAGFSLGGVLAAVTAARLGDQVRKLSLMGVGGFGVVKKVPSRPIPDDTASEAERRDAFRFNLSMVMIANEANLTDEAIDMQAANYYRTRFDGRRFSLSNCVADSLGKIRGPIQFIYGDRDALGAADLTRRADVVRRARPDAIFEILPGAGHWVQYEAAERVNRMLVAFLADTPGGAP